MAWTSKREFGQLSADLAMAQELDFERKSLPYLRAIWPQTRPTPHRRSFDRAGADHVVWAENPPFPVVIQCKGFQVLDHELGASQIRQCRESIRSFAESGVEASLYLLVHNRTGANKIFREAVNSELRALVESGQVKRAELWDRQRLLREAFDAMLVRVRNGITERNLAGAAPAPMNLAEMLPLETVPLRRTVLVADQNKLRSRESRQPEVGDPAKEILTASQHGLALLIGEFGFGKTTAVARALTRSDQHVVYVPGATLSKATVGAKDLFVQCIDTESVLSDFPEEDRGVLMRVLRPAVEYLFKEKNLGIVLVLDGVDESAFLGHGGAIQQLFNMLETVASPVVITMRTEFWLSRYAEFESVFGDVAKHGEPRNKKIQMVELLPWGPNQIRELVAKETSKQKAQGRRENLTRLLKLVGTSRFEELYGDIPKRPLFLRFILDSVAAQGLPGQMVGRARLLHDWARAKIARDVQAPNRAGGGGRAAVGAQGESLGTTIELAWEAMLSAAGSMTKATDGQCEILAEADLDNVLANTERLSGVREPTGLFLNSLLLPTGSRTGTNRLRVRFAHRAFQEFFLAWYSLLPQSSIANLALPPEVLHWQHDIVSEGLIR